MQIKCSSPIIACRSYLSHVIILLGVEEPILQTSDPRDATMLKVFPVITDLIQSYVAEAAEPIYGRSGARRTNQHEYS